MSQTPDLFADDPLPMPRSMLSLVASPGVKLSAAQKSFTQLVTDIAEEEQSLLMLANLQSQFRQQFAEQLNPLESERDKFNYEMVLLLDAQLARKSWTASQRATMQEILCALAEQLFDSPHGEKMKAIFDRHSVVTAAESFAIANEEITSEIEQLFGVNKHRDDGSARTIEEMIQEAKKLEDDLMRDHAAQIDARASAKRGGKKTARQEKAEQQAIDTAKLLKEIYRKLSSVIHPDREPDPAERARKTALMSELNQAYESKNLLKLLTLQQQFGKLDSAAVASQADDKLKLINHQLRQQLADLRGEHMQLEMQLRAEFLSDSYSPVSMRSLKMALLSTTAAMTHDLKTMKADLATISKGDAPFKRWLNDQAALMQNEDDDINDFMAMMMPPLRAHMKSPKKKSLKKSRRKK
jgi:curved DNA-binding protein CbpA